MGLSAEDADRMAESLKPVFADLQPIKRSGLPEDIAQAALWLASDESSFVNGRAMVVDGGLTGGRQWAGDDPEASPLMAALMQAFEHLSPKDPQ